MGRSIAAGRKISRTHAVAALLLVAATAAACARSVGQPGGRPASASDTLGGGGPTSIADNRLDLNVGAPDATAPRVATAAATIPTWGRTSETSGELFTVLDGMCRRLGVSILENGAFFHYDGVFGRLTDDGVEVDAAMNAGFAADVHYVTGRWPDAAYAIFEDGLRTGGTILAKRYQGDRWKNAFALPVGHGVETVKPMGNGAIGLRSCGGGAEACVAGVFIGDNAKAPPIAGDGFVPNAYEVLPTGEVFAVGIVCPRGGPAGGGGCGGQLRWWSPGTKVGYAPLGPTDLDRHGALVVRSKSEVYVSFGTTFGSFDGTKLTKLPSPSKERHGRLYDAKTTGSLWLEAGNKLWERKADGTFTDITPPRFSSSSFLAGVEVGAPYHLEEVVLSYTSTQKPELHKRVGTSWQKADLPRPSGTWSEKPFLTPQFVAVRAPDDVFVIASYHEMPPGWNEAERRRVLLRSKKPKETVRCGGDRGVQSWPPPAHQSCTTPFVLLAEVSATSPKDYDYPQTRALFAPKVAMIVGGTIAEIRENGKVWIGVVPQTVADGRKLAELYATRFIYTRPEVVCATPTATRTVAIAKP